MPQTFILSRPVRSHSKDSADGVGEVSEFVLRDPTPDDWFALGDITQQIVSSDGRTIDMRLRHDVVRAWLVRLSGQPGTVLGTMEMADLNAMVAWLNAKLSVDKTKN